MKDTAEMAQMATLLLSNSVLNAFTTAKSVLAVGVYASGTYYCSFCGKIHFQSSPKTPIVLNVIKKGFYLTYFPHKVRILIKHS